MTRVHADGLPVGGWGQLQKLTAYQSLKAYTYGAAYSVGLENKIGQIKSGYFADIAVIDTNLLKANPEEIKIAKNLITMVNGEILYRRI
jgi:predicted amidohydrolase YtcJ